MPNAHPNRLYDLNFFQLACLFGSSVGLPAMAIIKQLAAAHGSGITICSVSVGNLLLWLIGIAIISMSEQDRINAIGNAKKYLGVYGGMLFTLILIVAFFNWYIWIINFSINALGDLLPMKQETDLLVRIGAGLGLLTSLLSIGNLKLYKWLAIVSLPLLIAYHLFSMAYSISSSPLQPMGTWGLSAPAIATSMLIFFPGIINLPTIFKHSRSKFHSYLSLSVIITLFTFFELSSIWIDYSISSSSNLLLTIFTLFVVVKLIYPNLLNIFFASACWETYFPHFEGAKGHAIIGLFGTAAYTFIQISAPMLFIRDLTDAYIASFTIVLLVASLIQLVVRHRPRILQKTINTFCWFIGCLISTLWEIQSPSGGTPALLAGMAASVLSFLLIIFIEETCWSIKMIRDKVNTNARPS